MHITHTLSVAIQDWQRARTEAQAQVQQAELLQAMNMGDPGASNDVALTLPPSTPGSGRHGANAAEHQVQAMGQMLQFGFNRMNVSRLSGTATVVDLVLTRACRGSIRSATKRPWPQCARAATPCRRLPTR